MPAHRLRTGRLPALVALVGTLAALLVLVPASAALAIPPTVTPAVTTFQSAPDHMSDQWGDPWDFSNALDLDLTPNVVSGNVSEMTMADGRLNWMSWPGGFIEPLTTLGIPPHNRDSELKPVDAAKYSRISFRMFSGASANVAGGIFWFNCWNRVNCNAAMSFEIKPGWQTYDMAFTPDLMNQIGGWSGQITFLRLYPGGNQPYPVTLDWMRLYEPAGDVTLNVVGGAGTTVWWDADANPSNNANSPTAGIVAGSGSTRTFNASAYPPGAYRFYAVNNDGTSAYSAPLNIDAAPLPVVLDPDVAGGDDFATVVRGDAWDFDQVSDIQSLYSVAGLIDGGMLHASGNNPEYNDPRVELRLPGPIDARVWHRLNFRIWYDEPFGLADAPGGGMVMRLIWRAGGSYHDGQDIVVVPGWNDVSLDLTTNPLSAIEDENAQAPYGWGGPLSPTVDFLRFDPHEDPGDRNWKLDFVGIARNDRGTPNYDIRFQDMGWEAGTTAEIWVDSDAAGFNGTRVAQDIDVAQGVNTYRWNGSGVAPGTWWVYVVLQDPDGTQGRSYSSGPVDMPEQPNSPFGSIDATSLVPGGVQLGGWAIDGSAEADTPIDVHVYRNGVFAGATTTGQTRPDVAVAYPGYGSTSGYGLAVGTPSGPQDLCAYGINVGPGANQLLSCRRFDVPADPFGSFDAATVGPPGTVDISGWAIEPSSADPVPVHVYVNGVGAGVLLADTPRGDLATAYPGFGANHAFTARVAVHGGANNVCAYAINSGDGQNTALGCRTVNVASDPIGSLDVVQHGAGSLAVAGWAIDPQTAQPIAVHIYVGGAGYSMSADGSRPDLGAAFPFHGADHGFSATLPAPPPGGTSVCAYAMNVGSGANTLLGCRTVNVPTDPVGSLDVVQRSGGELVVSGWAIDPQTPSPIAVHVYVGGAGYSISADVNRPDLGAVLPMYGPDHGFSATFAAPPPGTTVCVYAINVGPGASSSFGCRTV